MFLGFQVFVFK